jgi:uncharacterized protein
MCFLSSRFKKIHFQTVFTRSHAISIGLIILIASMACVSCNSSPEPAAVSKPSQYAPMDWGQLTPHHWDANSILKKIDLSKMDDNDPRAFDLLKDVREQWNNAPVVESLDGKAITIHGYTAPLNGDSEYVKEFLLVPYFGACIHSPPPPSNQVIHVHLAGKGIPLSEWSASLSVSGILKVGYSDSAIGTASYQMQADIVKPSADAVP